jgi:hypothetical protein
MAGFSTERRSLMNASDESLYLEDEDEIAPDFALSVFKANEGRDASDVELMIHVLEYPSSTTPASLALLYGLAILSLDRAGVIHKTIDRLTTDGLPSEAAAVRMINYLMEGDENDYAS